VTNFSGQSTMLHQLSFSHQNSLYNIGIMLFSIFLGRIS